MFGIILISHSKVITDGLKEMITEMVGSQVNVFSAGGADDGALGTSPNLIMDGIQSCQGCSRILLFCDIGSSILSAETAIERLANKELRNKCILMNSPLVEGAFVAAVQSMVTDNINDVIEEVNEISDDYITGAE